MSEQQKPKRKKRRRMKKSVARFFVLLIALGVMAGLSFLITGLIQRGANDDISASTIIPDIIPDSVENSAPGQSEPDKDPEEFLSSSDAIDPSSWNFVGPVQQAVDEMVIITPDYRMLSVPENGRVDMRYFDTSVFVGDSITIGLEIYKQGIPNASYCAYKSASPKAIYDGSILRTNSGDEEVPLDALESYQPDNVYVLMGTNAMVAMDDEALLAYYSDMLDAMRERLHPDVTFYVQSITPTLQKVESRFGKDRIAGLNNQLAKMAWEKGMYFIDLHEALAGEDGWLREEFGAQSDGYHLTPLGYSAWVEYLVTHTVYKPMHADKYLEGSNYYAQIEPPAKEEPEAAEEDNPENTEEEPPAEE